MSVCMPVCIYAAEVTSLTDISVKLNGTYGVNYNVLCNIVDSSNLDDSVLLAGMA